VSFEVPQVRTERLLLRGWEPSRDLEAMAAMNADPEVVRYLKTGTPIDDEETAESIARWTRRWDEQGFGLWAVERLEDGRLIGRIGLTMPLDFPQLLPVVEVGWLIDRPLWGKGYATEGALASVDFAWSQAGLDRVISIIKPGNAASIRVAQKLGMHEIEGTEDVDAGRVRVFELRRP
jgi:RimJ/RimL family protein N-acetyltransferase